MKRLMPMLESARYIFNRLKEPFSPKTRASIFTEIHRKNYWQDEETVSGPGSSLARTAVIRTQLPDFLFGLGAESLLDAACGDFNWMRYVSLESLDYTGADIVPELIEHNNRTYARVRRKFVVRDIVSDSLPGADAILCRDCFIHLSFADIMQALANFRASNSAYLLATTHPQIKQNRDIATGGWRSINLSVSPFDFPDPLDSIVENVETGKSLGFWRLADLKIN